MTAPGRKRRLLALIVLGCFIVMTALRAPMRADANAATEAALPAQLDPNVARLLRSKACGMAAPSDLAQVPVPNPDASPSPSASLIPIPRALPNGPGTLVPPTPRATGDATPTPVPLPSSSPSPSASGPVFIVRPSGTPSPLVPVGSSPLPGASASPGASALPDAGASPGTGGTPEPLASGAPPLAYPDGSPSPVPSGEAASPAPTLGPYQIVTVADHITGSTEAHQPGDLIGNVHIFYVDGQVVGDRAHYDGDHTLTVTGHTYLVNRSADSILYGDKIEFDTNARKATLTNGSGESIEGVAQGKLHFSARNLTTDTNGVSHGDKASFTTCEHPHGGYHIEARSIDLTPGDRLVARRAVVFLGPTAIFFLPILIIPLRSVDDPRRQASFLPIVGYDDYDGFYIKLRLSFAPSNTYYGYYRVEYFTRRGLGLGYTAFAGAANGRRALTVDSYTIGDRQQGARLTNINLQETENYNQRLRSLVGVSYQSDYGPSLSLPATFNLNGSLIHQGNISTENLTFSRYSQGQLADDTNLGFTDSINLSTDLQQQLNLAYSKFNNQIASTNTFHVNTDTHLFTKAADYNLTYDKTDYSSNPNGYDRVPELQVTPHLTYGGFKYGPTLQFTAGQYTETQNHFSTQRVQGVLNESVYAKIFGQSDFSANYNLTQDYYGTGDLKAYDTQNASLNTPVGQHFVNSLTYNEQHPIGPPDVPFQLFDRLSGGSHNAQDFVRFFNRDYYTLSVGTGTNFNRQAQAVNYQLTVRPSYKSYVAVGGYYQPGPGNGFYQTNVQAITPFGRDTTLELSTNVDWKQSGRFLNKNIYLSRNIDNCYNVTFTYNEDLKSFNFSFTILAFPSQSAGFGFGGVQTTGIVPGVLGL